MNDTIKIDLESNKKQLKADIYRDKSNKKGYISEKDCKLALSSFEIRIPSQLNQYLRNQTGKADVRAAMLLSYLLAWHKPRIQIDKIVAPIVKENEYFQTTYSHLSELLNISKETLRKKIVFLEKIGLLTREIRHIKKHFKVLKNTLNLRLNFDKINQILSNKKYVNLGLSPQNVDTRNIDNNKYNRYIINEGTNDLSFESILEEGIITKEIAEKTEIGEEGVRKVVDELAKNYKDKTFKNKESIEKYIIKTLQSPRSFSWYLDNSLIKLLSKINQICGIQYTLEELKHILEPYRAINARYSSAEKFAKYVTKILSSIEKQKAIEEKRAEKQKAMEIKLASKKDKQATKADTNDKRFTDFAKMEGISMNLQMLQKLEEKYPEAKFKSEASFRKYMEKVQVSNKEPRKAIEFDNYEKILLANLAELNKKTGRSFSEQAAIYLLNKLKVDYSHNKFYTEGSFLNYMTQVFKKERFDERLLGGGEVQFETPKVDIEMSKIIEVENLRKLVYVSEPKQHIKAAIANNYSDGDAIKLLEILDIPNYPDGNIYKISVLRDCALACTDKFKEVILAGARNAFSNVDAVQILGYYSGMEYRECNQEYRFLAQNPNIQLFLKSETSDLMIAAAEGLRQSLGNDLYKSIIEDGTRFVKLEKYMNGTFTAILLSKQSYMFEHSTMNDFRRKFLRALQAINPQITDIEVSRPFNPILNNALADIAKQSML